jgi:hypothetical protein
LGDREDVRWQRAQDRGGRGRSYLQTCITRSGGGEIYAWLSLRATILHQKLRRAPPMKLAAEDVAELDQRREDV